MRLYISMYVARPAHIESTVHTGFEESGTQREIINKQIVFSWLIRRIKREGGFEGS